MIRDLIDDPTLTEWLIDAQAGDRAAFDDLHDALAPNVHHFAYRLVGHTDAAEDITQEVFLTLYKNLDAIDPPEKLRPYVFRVARHRCYDHLRKVGRRDHISLDDEPVSARVSFAEAHRNGIAPDEAAHWILLLLEVREAIDALPDAQRQTLILYSEENLSYAEIAEVMDVSVGTVKSRLHHAKKALRGALKPQTLLAITETIEE
jgi:RNA polymerase sigma-70 factor (ECF subfamily)